FGHGFVADREIYRFGYAVPLTDPAAIGRGPLHGLYLFHTPELFDTRVTLDNLSSKPIQITIHFFGTAEPSEPYLITLNGGTQYTDLLSSVAPRFGGFILVTYSAEPGSITGHIMVGNSVFPPTGFHVPVIALESLH